MINRSYEYSSNQGNYNNSYNPYNKFNPSGSNLSNNKYAYKNKYSSTNAFQNTNPYTLSGSFKASNIKPGQNELPLKLSESLSLRKSPERKTPCKSVLIADESCLEVLKIIIDTEMQVEQKKIDNFWKIPEFSIDDVFLFFESEDTENDILTPQDIKEGLVNKMGCKYSDEDITFLLAKFDLSNDGGISFANLFDMLVPFDKRKRDDIENRNSTGSINQDIVNGLKDYLDFIFESEKKIDEVRCSALENKKFDPVKYFQEQIDTSGTGVISIQDLEQFLMNKGVIKNQREADLLFIRLDRNRDGKVNVEEFSNEFTLFDNKDNNN